MACWKEICRTKRIIDGLAEVEQELMRPREPGCFVHGIAEEKEVFGGVAQRKKAAS